MSIIERFAQENGFKFVDISETKPEIIGEGFDYDVFLKGDVDLDGNVSVMDTTMVQRWLIDETELNQIQRHNAIVGDVYDDITIMSATTIQRYIAQLTPYL